MKIIVSRDLDKIFTKIEVFKNEQKIMLSPIGKDYCVLDAKEGDQIVIRLKYLMGMYTIASFVYHEGLDTFYVSTTKKYKIWMLVNCILAYLNIFLVGIKSAVNSEVYDWFCTVMVVLMALSLIIAITRQHNKVYNLEIF